MEDFPLVDLSVGSSAVSLLRSACTNHGFFYLKGHGVAQELMDNVLAQSKAFFELPLEQKRMCMANKHNRGYNRFGEECLDPKNQTQGDTKEGFYVGREPDEDEVGKFPVLGPNVWPQNSLLPDFRPTMEKYLECMSDLGREVSRLLAVALDLDATFFDAAFKRPLAFVRLLHYTPQLSDPERGLFAAGAHSDYGMITFLLTDGEPGLQVYIDGEWTDVTAPSGVFICNLGDMLERWSNSYFQSTKHRVVNTTGRNRYSVPFFFDPGFDTMVSSVPTCGAPKFEPISSGAYLLSRYNETHADFAKTEK